MAHVGQEFRFQLVGAPQVIGFFIQFRIERHDAAIGVFQFAVDPGQFRLPGADLLQRPEQFLILILQFLKRILRALARKVAGNARQIRAPRSAARALAAASSARPWCRCRAPSRSGTDPSGAGSR